MNKARVKNKAQFLKDVSEQWNKNMDALIIPTDKELLSIAGLKEK